MYYPYFWQILCQKMTHTSSSYSISMTYPFSGIEENIRFCHVQVLKSLRLIIKVTAFVFYCLFIIIHIFSKWNEIRIWRWLKPLILGDETFVTKPCASCQKELTIFRSNMKGGWRDTWCQLSKIQHTTYMISKHTFSKQL